MAGRTHETSNTEGARYKLGIAQDSPLSSFIYKQIIKKIRVIYSSLERDSATRNIYKEYDLLGKRSSISEQRGEGSSCIGEGQACAQAPRLLHILKRGGRVEGWLGRASALSFLLRQAFYGFG